MNFYDDIVGSDNWTKVELVAKGWSEDKKYHIHTRDGRELLLRLSDISKYDLKQAEFEIMKTLSQCNILMSHPLEFGVCNQAKSVYLLLTWIKGEEAEIAVKRYSENEQYVFGIKAGEYLQQIHKFPAPEPQVEWYEKFNRKIDRNIRNYMACGINIKGANVVIEYINANRELLRNRPQCFQHGDYHTGNMIITHHEELGIIDFNRWDYGDPWEEFNRIVWCVKTSKHFASGYINGYFNNKVPDLFFRLMALYVTANQLASIPWAVQFGRGEIDVMISLAQDVIDWYDGFKQYVPKWYFTINN
jgi:aminoglycoside phosphotransferase (APT) family kinase protein